MNLKTRNITKTALYIPPQSDEYRSNKEYPTALSRGIERSVNSEKKMALASYPDIAHGFFIYVGFVQEKSSDLG